MKWIQYKVHTTTDAADIIGELLYELGIQGFEISDHVPLTPEEEKQMYTDIPADLGPDDGKAVLTFYTEGDNTPEEKEFYSTGSSLRDAANPIQEGYQDPEELVASLRSRIADMQQFCPFPDPVITYSVQDDAQWKDKWKDSFHPFRVTDDLIVTPVWEPTPEIANENDTILLIEPGSAFGTGTHETTRLCMTSLRSYIHKDTRIMDAGCGRGGCTVRKVHSVSTLIHLQSPEHWKMPSEITLPQTGSVRSMAIFWRTVLRSKQNVRNHLT